MVYYMKQINVNESALKVERQILDFKQYIFICSYWQGTPQWKSKLGD